MNWLDFHLPVASFGASRSLEFSSHYCKNNCLRNGLPDTVYSDRPPDSMWRDSSQGDHHLHLVTAEAAYRLWKRDPDAATWVHPHDFERLTHDPGGVALADLDSLDALTTFQEQFAHCSATTQEDFNRYMERMDRPLPTKEDILEKLPDVLKSRWKAFCPQEADKMPPRRPGVDHVIYLDKTAAIPRPRIYGLSRQESEAVKVYLDDMLSKGFIRPSTSPYAAPVLVVKKPSGGLRICVDYRGINSITRKNRNAPPAIRETLATLNKACIISVVDVIAAFNAVRIKEGDEEKTAFLTRYGLYEYLVMPFGLCNAPGTFQNFINTVLRDFLDEFCSAYMDDVLIYSEREEDHERHVLTVVDRLLDHGLFLDVTKCKSKTTRVKYLGLIITTDGIEMNPEKVKALLDWQLPHCLKDVQAFLGFANFYRRFILGFSAIAKPLTALTRKEVTSGDAFPLKPGTKEAVAFESLKQAFTKAPVLVHFNPDLPIWLETDASDYVLGAVLSQIIDEQLRPIAFLSKKMTPAECNYEIYDKELLAIVRAFEEWRYELAGSKDPIEVVTDHQSLQHFMTTKRLNRRQARWAEFLAEFNFRIKYRPGKQSTKPDALTRRPGNLPESETNSRTQHQMQILLPPERFEKPREWIRDRDAGAHHAVHMAQLITKDPKAVSYTAAELALMM